MCDAGKYIVKPDLPNATAPTASVCPDPTPLQMNSELRPSDPSSSSSPQTRMVWSLEEETRRGRRGGGGMNASIERTTRLWP